MSNELKSNLLSPEHWTRVLFMVLLALCYQIANLVMWAVVIGQFLTTLFTGRDNVKLRAFGQSLSDYIHQILNFLTYNTEDKAFPFADWPEIKTEVVHEGEIETRDV